MPTRRNLWVNLWAQRISVRTAATNVAPPKDRSNHEVSCPAIAQSGRVGLATYQSFAPAKP